MNHCKKYLFVLIGFLIIAACRKEAPAIQGAATLTLVNTLLQGKAMMLSSHTQVISNNAFAHVGLVPGLTDLYVFPVGDSLSPYYTSDKALPVKEGEVYTFLLSGPAAAPDALMLTESLPRHTDSTMGVRFINCSPGSPAVMITLSTSATKQEFAEVGYQQVTPFRSYPITSGFKTYTFQVRESATGKLITSVTLTGTNLAAGLPRFKNVSLVLRGLVDGSPAAGITRINHY